MLSATLTRPTTISPTTTHDTKVDLVETIDIAPILEPKPRVISLEPILRRSRARSNTKKRTTPADSPQQSVDGAEVPRNSRVPELSSVTESHTPGSPAPSDVSFDSQFSNVTGSGIDSGRLSVSTGDSGGTLNGSKTSLKEKTITATIELLKAGFLRGDIIPVKISVNHTKHIKSFHGIIITLYRQARVDMHPALPVAPNNKADKANSEDYYPKSRTGLGGLSLSSAGSSHVFRKDLAQSFAPLFVDPRTFTAEVKASVRVPEGAFPTISSVPGAMISFKYYVEVVVDLQGKLAGLDKLFPSSGLVNVPTTLGTAPAASRFEDPVCGMVSAWGGNFIDTESIRRDKSVVTCVFEVVIGTKDSDRKGKRKQERELEPETQQGVHQIELAPGDPRYHPSAAEQEYYGYDYQDQYHGQYGYGERYQDGYQGEYPEGYYPENAYQNYGYPTAEPLPHPQFPPPNPEPESQLSEKERLRQAEAGLLPSQPPTTPDPSCEAITAAAATAPQVLPPSAPDLPDESPTYRAAAPPHQLPHADDTRTFAGPSTPPFLPAQHTTSSSSTITALDHPPRAPRSSPPPPSASAPSYTPHAGPPSPSHPAPLLPPTDDKQELQRRHLELERSAPEDVPDGEGEEGAVRRPVAAVLAPSAPVLDEDEDDDDALLGRGAGAGAGAGARMELPRYER